jgi:palmitoyltransferase
MAKDGARQPDRTCCGVIQEAKYQAREKHTQRTKPQPWIVLKLTIGITVAIVAYASYTYIGRFCVPMMLKQDGALGSQATGSKCLCNI